MSSGYSENKGLWRLLSLAGSQNLPYVDLISLYLPTNLVSVDLIKCFSHYQAQYSPTLFRRTGHDHSVTARARNQRRASFHA